MAMLSKFVCLTEEKAHESEGELIGDDYEIIFGPAKLDYGTTDMTKYEQENHPYANAWIVIGLKQ